MITNAKAIKPDTTTALKPLEIIHRIAGVIVTASFIGGYSFG
jgi:hypothetical protein